MDDVKGYFQGKEYHLLFNGYAMFAEEELFDGASIVDAVGMEGKEGIEPLAKAFCLLAEQGELARRYAGYTPQDIPDPERVKHFLMPYELPGMRKAVLTAVLQGYGREEQKEEIDLGLVEMQKKTGTA